MQLKGFGAIRIVTAMKRSLILLSLLLLPSLASAQAFQFGILGGAGRSMEDGFELDFDEGVVEVFAGARVDWATMFNIKLGQTDMPVDPLGVATSDGSLDYLAAQVEYRFDEVWGSSAVFAGPGVYRGETADLEETELGFSLGVNAGFPITPRFAAVLELGYHWVNFETDYTFLTATGGLRVSF